MGLRYYNLTAEETDEEDDDDDDDVEYLDAEIEAPSNEIEDLTDSIDTLKMGATLVLSKKKKKILTLTEDLII